MRDNRLKKKFAVVRKERMSLNQAASSSFLGIFVVLMRIESVKKKYKTKKER